MSDTPSRSRITRRKSRKKRSSAVLPLLLFILAGVAAAIFGLWKLNPSLFPGNAPETAVTVLDSSSETLPATEGSAWASLPEAPAETPEESRAVSTEESTAAATETVSETTAEPTEESTEVTTEEESTEETTEAPEPTAPAGDPASRIVPEENLTSHLVEHTPQNSVLAEEYLKKLTLREKICQLIIASNESTYGPNEDFYKEYPVGGLILFAEDLVSIERTINRIRYWQSYTDASGMRLFISVDEEGGSVQRVAKALGTTHLSPMYDYHEEGYGTALQNAQTIATDLHSLGFNLDFAPVADTWSNPENRVIAKRAYSQDYDEAAWLVRGAVKGFHRGGIMCTVKHFPGHGDTKEDSHAGTAYCYKSREELYAGELKPFISGINAGADMVMVGHITVPALDEELPASLSPTIINGLLREELGYQGVVITDSLSMGAITNKYGAGKVAVMALQAGGDILLCQSQIKDVVAAVEKAVADGTLSEERINESVLRVLKLKEKYGLLEPLR